jgi:hypothetical protein
MTTRFVQNSPLNLRSGAGFPIVTAVHGETSNKSDTLDDPVNEVRIPRYTADNLDPRIANKIRPIIYQDNPVDDRPTTREKLPRYVIRSNAIVVFYN